MEVRASLVYNNLPKLKGQLRINASRAVHETMLELEKTLKETLTGQRSGRVYIRGGRAHQASAPGEPPAVDTGTLRNSVAGAMVGDLTAVVGVGAPYAHFLEFGTRKMAPRPYFLPSVERVRPSFMARMRRLLE